MSLATQGNVTQDPTIQGSCLGEGEWYLCSAQSPRFLGCCTSDPCNPKGCPKNDLRSASLGAGPGPDACENDSSLFPNVACPTGSKWYTCLSNKPSFQGCCSVNPCHFGSCPAESLYPASFVNSNLPPTVLESCSSKTSPTKATTVPTPSVSNSGLTHNLGAIIGLVLGVVAAVALLMTLGAFCWYRTRKSRAWHMRSHSDLTSKDCKSEMYRSPMFCTSRPAEVQPVHYPSKDNYQHLNHIIPATTHIHELGSNYSSPRDRYDVRNNTEMSGSPERYAYRASNMSDTTACSNQNRWSHELFLH